MFSVVVRGSWLIMEVVSGHVAYAALLCVLKPKKCTTSWKTTTGTDVSKQNYWQSTIHFVKF